MRRLYQFAISHFCEKARWALDYKNVEYDIVNLAPGAHSLTVRRFAPQSSVPVLKDGDKVIQGSAEIISYLDDQNFSLSLTPSAPAEKAKALEWESWLDKEIGIHSRLICYHYLLQHKRIVVPLMCRGTPWYNRVIMYAGFTKLEKLMRKYMKINAETVETSKSRLLSAVNKVNDHLATQEFLVGDHFTRADLTAAALVSPLMRNTESEGKQPAELTVFREALSEKIAWASVFYQKYRKNIRLC